MKISELIAELTAIQEQLGPDLEVVGRRDTPIDSVITVFESPTYVRLTLKGSNQI